MAEEVALKQAIKKIEVLEQKLRGYEEDAQMRAYYALKRIVNAQVDYINAFEINTHIGADPKTDKVYERAEKIWSGIKDLVVDLNSLKVEVKATDDEEIDLKRPGSFLDHYADGN